MKLATNSAENMAQQDTDSGQHGNNVLQLETTEAQPKHYSIQLKGNAAQHGITRNMQKAA